MKTTAPPTVTVKRRRPWALLSFAGVATGLATLCSVLKRSNEDTAEKRRRARDADLLREAQQAASKPAQTATKPAQADDESRKAA